jgi:predicted amino acid dehydrogenase
VVTLEMLPYLTGQAPWFAFLVHPRGVGDLFRAGWGSFLRQFSSSDTEFVVKMCSLPPVVLGEIGFGFAAVRGELVVAMCMPQEIMSKEGQQAIIRAAQLAADRGAKVLGLGALMAPAMGGGVLLLRHLPPGVTLTNGNAYTAAVVRHNVLEACSFLAHSRTCRVAVVGCTGSVGAATCHLLADAGIDLLLIGRNAERARSLSGLLAHQAVFSGELAAVREADIALVLTSDPSAKLSPDLVSPGTIVIDVSQPPNVSPEIRGAFQGRGIDVREGGIVQIPGYTCTYDLNMPAPGDTFACLAETYLFAREGMREHSVGRPNVELALHLERVAQRHGITPRPLDLGCPPSPPPHNRSPQHPDSTIEGYLMHSTLPSQGSVRPRCAGPNGARDKLELFSHAQRS